MAHLKKTLHKCRCYPITDAMGNLSRMNEPLFNEFNIHIF